LAVKQKGSFVGTLIGLVAVATIGYIVIVFINPSGSNSDKANQCTYLFTVTFNPTPQDPAADVSWAFAGEGTKKDTASTSPWNRSVPHRCGSAAVLTAKVDGKYMIDRLHSRALTVSIQHGDTKVSNEAQPGELSAMVSIGG